MPPAAGMHPQAVPAGMHPLAVPAGMHPQAVPAGNAPAGSSGGYAPAGSSAVLIVLDTLPPRRRLFLYYFLTLTINYL